MGHRWGQRRSKGFGQTLRSDSVVRQRDVRGEILGGEKQGRGSRRGVRVAICGGAGRTGRWVLVNGTPGGRMGGSRFGWGISRYKVDY